MSYAGPDRRSKSAEGVEMEPVFLEKKLADVLNGIVLAGFEVGDRVCLKRDQARLLIAEGWASPVPKSQRRKHADVSC